MSALNDMLEQRRLDMTDALSAAGSISGALISGRMTESQARWSRRHASADRTLGPLRALRRLMGQLTFSQNVGEWQATITAAMHSVQDERFRMPRTWAHLEQSLRESVACAVGLGLADRVSLHECEHHFERDPSWLMFAADYLDYVIPRIARWGKESRTRRANRIELVSFGHWLEATGRHSTRDGLWPGP